MPSPPPPRPFPLRIPRPPPLERCCAAVAVPTSAARRRGAPLRGPARNRRAPWGRLASLSLAPPSSASALLLHRRATARRCRRRGLARHCRLTPPSRCPARAASARAPLRASSPRGPAGRPAPTATVLALVAPPAGMAGVEQGSPCSLCSTAGGARWSVRVGGGILFCFCLI